ncbi:hypothetical protein EW146_g4188 [Bondarzewia mesenterica]|uniref:Uncharacterized protein n=1 Tax=Bondarzewia mesenterica TaxID=1095465 RepID=A0A4S4LV97_9AGAM|nr:hypothetical protein EW146_g4188 [Bondarzewia mesenterica]
MLQGRNTSGEWHDHVVSCKEGEDWFCCLECFFREEVGVLGVVPERVVPVEVAAPDEVRPVVREEVMFVLPEITIKGVEGAAVVVRVVDVEDGELAEGARELNYSNVGAGEVDLAPAAGGELGADKD